VDNINVKKVELLHSMIDHQTTDGK